MKGFGSASTKYAESSSDSDNKEYEFQNKQKQKEVTQMKEDFTFKKWMKKFEKSEYTRNAQGIHKECTRNPQGMHLNDWLNIHFLFCKRI